jgi:F-type H+-transporting ATPase subunit alpha
MEIRLPRSRVLKTDPAFDTEANVAETGQVLSVGDGIACVFGLQNCGRRDGGVPAPAARRR